MSTGLGEEVRYFSCALVDALPSMKKDSSTPFFMSFVKATLPPISPARMSPLPPLARFDLFMFDIHISPSCE